MNYKGKPKCIVEEMFTHSEKENEPELNSTTLKTFNTYD